MSITSFSKTDFRIFGFVVVLTLFPLPTSLAISLYSFLHRTYECGWMKCATNVYSIGQQSPYLFTASALACPTLLTVAVLVLTGKWKLWRWRAYLLFIAVILSSAALSLISFSTTGIGTFWWDELPVILWVQLALYSVWLPLAGLARRLLRNEGVSNT